MIEKLTPEQIRIVEENHNLIYFVIHKNKWNIEECYGAAALGLCLAARNFDPSRGTKFSTYAIKTITYSIKNSFRRQQWHAINTTSLDAAIFVKDNGSPVALGDLVEDPIDRITDAINLNDFREALDELGALYKELYRLYAQGFTQTEIAHKLGISQPMISRKINQIKKYLQA